MGCPVRRKQLPERLRAKQRRIAGEDEQISVPSVERSARRCKRVTRSARLGLHGDLIAVECVGIIGPGHDDERVGTEAARGLQNPVDEAPAEQRMQMLRRLGAHARTESASEDDC